MFYTPTHQVREFLSHWNFVALKFKEMMYHWELITPSVVYLCIEQESQNHSMADVAMDFLRWSSPASRLKQGHPEQVVPSLVQSGLEYLHWLRLHSLYAAVPLFDQPQNKEVLILCSEAISCVSFCAPCLLSCHWAPLRRVWLPLLHSLTSGAHGILHRGSVSSLLLTLCKNNSLPHLKMNSHCNSNSFGLA